jgi:hypothetical protein
MPKVKTLTMKEVLAELRRIEADCFRARGHILANYEGDAEKARAILRETTGAVAALVDADWSLGEPEVEWSFRAAKRSKS